MFLRLLFDVAFFSVNSSFGMDFDCSDTLDFKTVSELIEIINIYVEKNKEQEKIEEEQRQNISRLDIFISGYKKNY